MIKISKSGNAILVEGLDNVFYPNNGKITYPSNSIILTLDKSNMATFRSAANNDVLFSGLIEDITIAGSAVTKDNIVTSFGAIAYSTSGGGGGTGAVSSVNGQTGDVIITAASIDAAPNSELTSVRNRVGANEKNIANNSGSISTLQTNMLNKQDTLVSGTNIKTIGGESILGSGNIIEKEPAFDTWNKGEHISAGLNSNASGTSVSIGKNSASRLNSVAIGSYSNTSDTVDGTSIGAYSEVTNDNEIGIGTNNKSVSEGADADKTQFTVAAADATQSDKKNCFEIRRDNSIYIWKDNVQVKLQDQLGGGSGGGVTSVNGQTGDVTLSIPNVQTTGNGDGGRFIYSNSSSQNYRTIATQRLIQAGGYTTMEYWYWGQSDKEKTILDFPWATTENGGDMSPQDKTKLDSIPTMSVLTQAEYNAITTKDANTLYFIKEG